MPTSTKFLFLFLCTILVSGCATKSGHAFLAKETTAAVAPASAKYSLVPVSESQIWVEHKKILRLTLNAAHLANLHEPRASKKGLIADREVLLYAKVYKNSVFQGYQLITNVAEHMRGNANVAIESPIFFTETIDGPAKVELKAYEIDASGLTKLLRRIKGTDLSTLEGGPYDPGETFTKGLADTLFGLFDIMSSVTGRSIDGWVAKIGADKVLEHTIYISPIEDPTTKQFKAKDKYYFIVGDEPKDLLKSSTKKNDAEISADVEAALATFTGSVSNKIDDDMLNGMDIPELDGYTYLIMHAEQK
ncbi:MAG: hypothetical protein HOE54_11650 [Gammaproteobacteria bacterium]|nr:hypothetical protein [Gammaproteobacteria bacterium]